MGNINTLLTTIDRSTKQKINKEKQTLNDTIDQLDLIDIYRTFHSKTMNVTLFSSAHGTISRIDQILGHKSAAAAAAAAAVASVMSDSVQPHRWQPTRLPCPWDSPGKNTGVGCHFLLQCVKVKSESDISQSCSTFSDPMDCSPPGSSIHGIFQARVLEWGAIAFFWAISLALVNSKNLKSFQTSFLTTMQ